MSCKDLFLVYIKLDVVFSAPLFKNFIKISYKEGKNFPLPFLPLPGYTWDAELKYPKN